MLWTPTQQFHPGPFDKEAELEAVIAEVKAALFGESRIYLDVKKLIGERGKTQNIPDGYLLDLSSPRKPVLSGQIFAGKRVADGFHCGSCGGRSEEIAVCCITIGDCCATVRVC